jgi:hypothetical protein
VNLLQFPQYPFKLRGNTGSEEIWDEVRRKWVVCTPEEWVRQHCVRYLIEELGYPPGLLSVEKGLKVNGLSRRTDVVVYSRKQEPLLIVECKAPEVALSQSTFDQVARYNLTLRVPYLLITNGLNHYCCRVDFASNSYSFLQSIPHYTDI